MAEGYERAAGPTDPETAAALDAWGFALQQQSKHVSSHRGPGVGGQGRGLTRRHTSAHPHAPLLAT